MIKFFVVVKELVSVLQHVFRACRSCESKRKRFPYPKGYVSFCTLIFLLVSDEAVKHRSF